MSTVDLEFGSRLKRLRNEQGRSQEWLSSATGGQITQGGISKIESGVQAAYLSQAIMLASALGVSLHALLAGARPSDDDLLLEVAQLRAEVARLQAGIARGVAHLASFVSRGTEVA